MILKNSFVLLKENESGGEGFWAGKVLLFFKTELTHNSIKRKEYLTSVRYMECTEPMDIIDNMSQCFCWRRSTSDGIGYLKIKEKDMRSQTLVNTLE